MNLEGTVLSQMSDRERQMPQDVTYMWSLKNKLTKQAEQNRHRFRQHFDSCCMGGVAVIGEKGEGIKKYNWGLQSIRGGVKYSVGSTVNNTVITVMSDGY